MKVESGPTLDQRIRMGVFLIMCMGLGGYFLYDGYRGYPNKTLEWAKQKLSELSDEQRAAVRINPKVRFDAIKTVKEGDTIEELQAQFGSPSGVLPLRYRYVGKKIIATIQIDDDNKVVHIRTEEPNPNHDLRTDPRVTPPLVASIKPGVSVAEVKARLGEPIQTYPKMIWYIGIGSFSEFKIVKGRVGPEAVHAPNSDPSETDILLQKIIGFFLMVLAARFLFKYYRLLTLRIVVDDSGLNISGRQIGWDEMVALRTEKWDRKGWVDLEYGSGGSTRLMRLDSFHIEKFDDILAALCERKGFESPVKPDADDDSDADHDETAESPTTDAS